ncbi:Imm49 family immunity protein [Runella zeae]|uniref:Imm49 family immunity protein n=1 Tax=Runella zeae TaxID=94255 RepID=UPI0023538311|nr:Imm49 family immunity protein [Runella zeae]
MEKILLRVNELRGADFQEEKGAIELFDSDPDTMSLRLTFINEMRALHSHFINHDLAATKQSFYLCGRLSEYRVTNFDNSLLNYALNLVFYTFLSDNPHLIKRFTSWTYSKMDIMLDIGFHGLGALMSNTMQLLVKRDLEGVERNLEKLKKIVEKKSGAWAVLDYQFYKALAEQDKRQAEQLLAEFVSPKNHKARNKHFALVGELISVPAIGYAKLAWLLGMEVEVNSPYIPREWLPIRPLAVYDEYYDFLKQDKIKRGF